MCVKYLMEGLFDREPNNPQLNHYYYRRGEYLGDGVYLKLSMASQFAYNDNGRVVLFAGETFPGPTWRGRMIWSQYIRRWGDPRYGEPITEDEKQKIFEKLGTSTLGPFVDQSPREAGSSDGAPADDGG